MQLFEESIDGLRTYLTLHEAMHGMKVIAVSSAVSGEGKTSVAAQLAVSLASATGERTLLIDGDMRSPDVDKIFGVEREPGLADVLQGELPVEEAIETDFNGGHVRDDANLNRAIAAQTALGRVGLPDDVGGAVAMLLAPENHWITGQRIEASGGMLL